MAKRTTARKATNPKRKNATGPTYAQGMTLARAAGASIGDTSGFEPWLVRAKLDKRGPLVRSKLKKAFWTGVETGEAPESKEAKGKTLIFHGIKVWKDSKGWRASSDPDSVFDSLPDAKRFVEAQAKNPQVTDRALRYRANSPDRRPADPRECAFCGSDQNIEVGHLDGHEENDDPRNLVWNCRSCNTRLGHIFKTLGIGRRTRQYNPEAQGAQSYEQYATALDALKGGNLFMSVAAAVDIIHATSPEDRSYYARQIWRIRKERYGEGGTYKSGHRNPNGGRAA
jgi:hypothetical protein